MHFLIRVLLLVAVPLVSAAQTPPVIEGRVYVVTYAEVLPTAVKDGTTVLRQYRDAARKDTGNLRSELAQESGRPTRFVLLSVWSDQKALEAHSKGGGTALRDKFRSVQAAPLDERLHSGFAAEGRDAAAGAVTVATHVDVPPPSRETLEPLLKALAEASRKEGGNRRFEVQQQANRPNHFTVVETWSDQKAYDSHVLASHTRQFRDKLGPMTGALYDERLYRALD